MEAVEAEVFRETVASDPQRHAELRYELMIDLLVFGESSPLARQMQLPVFEVRHQAQATRAMLAELITATPAVRATLANGVRDALISQAIKSAGSAEEGAA